jgi:hypothetical protein
MRAATIPVDDGRLCASCMWLTAQQQLNREALDAGSASEVPAPAAQAWLHVDAHHAYLGCEGCIPSGQWVAWVGGLWLCPPCVASLRHGVATARGRQ